MRKDEEKQARIKEEKEIAMRQVEEEELRIKEENRRLKEWEEKFDKEQKIKEQELIDKFYSNYSKDQNKEEAEVNQVSDLENNDSTKNN